MKEDQTDGKSAAERETAEYDDINDFEEKQTGQEIFEW